MSADLHIHTTASDGRLSPPEVYRQALVAGLEAIAITDHDTTAGLAELKEYLKWAESSSLTVINGIELSCDHPDYEIHILGYRIDIGNVELNDRLTYLQNDRVNRAKKMVDKLNRLGYNIDFARVQELAGDAQAIGRPHVARALLEKGYFASMDEIFAGPLGLGGEAYVPHFKLNPKEAVALINQAGGIAVLAHPGLVGNDALVNDLLTSVPIKGLEVYHPDHSPLQTQKYLALARRYNLLVTGGSDFHGIPGRFPERLGDFRVDKSCADNLLNYVLA